ncbi:MAG: hypothetical protein M3548_15625 [Actinomycetota bacterium]|nr:hypothetical protein [Actinomycetota bacterium]
MAVLNQVQGLGQIAFHLVELGSRCRQAARDASQLAGNPLLLARDQVKGHRPAVDRFHQLLAFSFQCILLRRELLALGFCVRAAARQRGSESLLDRIPQGGVEPHRGPVLLDHLLDLGDQQGLAYAVRSLHLPADAHKVRVGDAMPVLGHGNDQPASAISTEHARLQIMPMFPLLLADQVHRKGILNLLPGHNINQRLMVPVMPNALVHHVSLVVRVGENIVEDIWPQRS